MDGAGGYVYIDALADIEGELHGVEPSPERDAKINLLKHLYIFQVQRYEFTLDYQYYSLTSQEHEKLKQIRAIASEGQVMQQQVLGSTEEYRSCAQAATGLLKALVQTVATSGCEVLYAEVKSKNSIERKANKFFGGDVRRVTDMARITVVCYTPRILATVFCQLQLKHHDQVCDIVKVRNGFGFDYMPGGYRDVNLNVVVGEHVCEIQLHLRPFHDLKGGQHRVYEWARKLNVTAEMTAEDLFERTSPEILDKMIDLARENWRGTQFTLPRLLFASGRYNSARDMLRKELSEHEQQLLSDEGSDGWRLTKILKYAAMTNLADTLQAQGEYDEALPLYERSDAILREVLGQKHPAVATLLNNRARLLAKMGKYPDADALYIDAKSIWEAALGPDHPLVATLLNNQALLLIDQGKGDAAEPLYKRAMEIDEKAYGRDHPNVAITLNNMAIVYMDKGNFADADDCNLRAIEIGEKMGLEHPDLATWINSRAGLFLRQEMYAEAEPLYKRSLDIREKRFGRESPAVASSLNNMAVLQLKRKKYVEAESLLEESLAIREKVLGADHVDVAASLSNLGGLFYDQAKYGTAQPYFERALSIRRNGLGSEHPDTISSSESVRLCRK